MKNKNTGKIIGGFLTGAGIITYILASKKDFSCDFEKKAIEIAHSAEEKVEEGKDALSNMADQVVNFIATNRPLVESGIAALFKTFSK